MRLLIWNLLEITVSQSIKNKFSHQLTIYSLFFFFYCIKCKSVYTTFFKYFVEVEALRGKEINTWTLKSRNKLKFKKKFIISWW